MIRLLISTGEVSGDLQGSLLVQALIDEARKRELPLEIVALGGQRMKAAGAELIADTASMGAIGLLEVLPFVLPTLRVQNKVDIFLKKNSLDGIVLIDYMGPNIRLGNKIKSLSPHLPIIYYIAPQEWAWRLGDEGTTDLIGFSDKILAIFKTEAEFYSNKGGKVTWVGHPMLDNLNKLPDRKVASDKLGIHPHQKLLLIFPASRSQELKYLMPTLAHAAALLQQHDPSIMVLVPSGLGGFEEPLRQALDLAGVIGRVISANEIDELKPFLFSAADLALSKSGTINMELALNGVPQIVGYKVSRITAFLARRVMGFNVDHISPVNLILKERLVPELVQEEFTAKSIFEAAVPLLSDSDSRQNMFAGYKRLYNNLGKTGVTNRAAKEILDLI